MQLKYYQVDAFTNQAFKGNPASVVPLTEWLPDSLMQNIAAEMNLSETAFFVRNKEGSYALRWFTPTIEVDLCGHATLASALVLREILGEKSNTIRFDTLSGRLMVEYSEGKYHLDMPVALQEEIPEGQGIISRYFDRPLIGIYRGRSNDMALFESEEDIRELMPDIAAIQMSGRDIIVTAKGADCDFVSRYFAPSSGIPEDPVTGSIHCQLVPFWAKILEKQELFARQISSRGGELWCRITKDRVVVSGHGICVMQGQLKF